MNLSNCESVAYLNIPRCLNSDFVACLVDPNKKCACVNVSVCVFFLFSSDDTASNCVLCGVMLWLSGADGIRFPRAPAEVRGAVCNDLSFIRAISLKAGETETENCFLSFRSVLQHVYNTACVTWIQTESILHHTVYLHVQSWIKVLAVT